MMASRAGVKKLAHGGRGERSFGLGEHVEVRQYEAGLKGSWHPGVVVNVQSGRRVVQYDELLTDDGQSKLKETVQVKEFVDGRKRGAPRLPWGSHAKRSRELIRPRPPDAPDPSSIVWRKGLCVDCFWNDAWWEGILTEPVSVYTSNKRVWVWFPEEKDWEAMPVHQMRLGQQWDEAKGSWRVKGVVNLPIPDRESRPKVPPSTRATRPQTRSSTPDDMRLAVSLNISQAGGAGREGKARDVARTEDVLGEQHNGLHHAGVADASRRERKAGRSLKVITMDSAVAHQNRMRQEAPTLNPVRVLRTRSLEKITPRSNISLRGRGREEASSSDSASSASSLDADEIDHPGIVVGKRSFVGAGKENLAKELSSRFDWTDETAIVQYGAMEQFTTSPRGVPGATPVQRTSLEFEPVAYPEDAAMMTQALETRSKKRGWTMGESNSVGDKSFFRRDDLMDQEPRRKKGRSVADDNNYTIGESQELLTPIHDGLRSKNHDHHQRGELNLAKASSRTRGFFPHQGGELKQAKKGKSTAKKGPGPKKGNRNRSAPRGGVTLEVLLSPDGRSGTNLAEGELRQKRTLLSWLIDSKIVAENEVVRYLHRKDGRLMLEGVVTRDGIMCKCCRKVVTLSTFEAHAGSKLHRPSANIFLTDGRSLSTCQKEALSSRGTADSKSACLQKGPNDESDDTCGICGDGGDLVCCDNCPSTFHLNCMGLEDVPDGEWYCLNCRCAACGESQFMGDAATFNDFTVILCDQCECKYHVKCLRSRGVDLSARPHGQFFCTDICKEIHKELRNMVGRSSDMEGGFSWTLLRSQAEDETNEEELSAEHDSKLSIALSVMRECFSPMTDPRTKIDIISHVLYNRRSDVTRLNFMGFYTMLLERGDELISVATIRIHGEKLAELPLIGTRYQYRRQGMCRRLLIAIEQMLKKLGVERIVLPAVAELQNTWTTHFGFEHMKEDEKRKLMDMNIMAFPGTAILYKQLDNKASSRGDDRQQTVELIEQSIEQSGMEVQNPAMLPSPSIFVKRGRGRPPKMKGYVASLKGELTVYKTRKPGTVARSTAKVIEPRIYYKAVAVKRGRGRPPKNKEACFKPGKGLKKVSTSLALISPQEVSQQHHYAEEMLSGMPQAFMEKVPNDTRNPSSDHPGAEPSPPVVRRKRGRPPRARSDYSSSMGILSAPPRTNTTEVSLDGVVGNSEADEQLPSLRRSTEHRRSKGNGASEMDIPKISPRTTRSKQQEIFDIRSLGSGRNILNTFLPMMKAVAAETWKCRERRKRNSSLSSESDTSLEMDDDDSDSDFTCGSSFVEHGPLVRRRDEHSSGGMVTVPIKSFPSNHELDKYGREFSPVETVVVQSGHNDDHLDDFIMAQTGDVSDTSVARTMDEHFVVRSVDQSSERPDGEMDGSESERLDDEASQEASQEEELDRLEDSADERLDEPLGNLLENFDHRAGASSRLEACDQSSTRKLVLKVKHPQRKEVLHLSEEDAIQSSSHPTKLAKGELIPPSFSISDQMQDLALYEQGQPDPTISSSRCIQVSV